MRINAIDLPDDAALDAAQHFGYEPTLPDPVTGLPVPNPVTSGQFLRAHYVAELRTVVRDYRARAAATAAESVERAKPNPF
jgi:hypothetical protein